MTDRRKTVSASRGSSRGLGVVSGYLLKVARESTGRTQEQLAEDLRVEAATVQGWETGRRPLTALRSSDLVRLRTRLIGLGLPPAIAMRFHDAIDADLVLATLAEAGDRAITAERHPLATSVHRRRLTNMITWPLTGLLPPELRRLPLARRARRGPVPDRPMLPGPERLRLFDHLLLTADAARRDQAESSLLRRQAIYLLGFDERPDSLAWLHHDAEHSIGAATAADGITSWAAVRSCVIALARRGDPDPLRRFVTTALADDQQKTANLNYWAYWVGEIDDDQPDDSFMIKTDLRSWSGLRLFEHLLIRLGTDATHADLNIHTLWALILARRSLLDEHPHLHSAARRTIDVLAGSDALSNHARGELANLSYAIRLAAR